jgi:hypothetical protein
MNIKIKNEYLVNKECHYELTSEELENHLRQSAPYSDTDDLEEYILEYVYEMTAPVFCEEDSMDTNVEDYFTIVSNLDDLVNEFSYFLEDYDDNN